MNHLEQTIYATVHDDPNLSTQQIADRMGVGRQILINKACPTTEHAYFSPAQLMQLQVITNNYAINDAMVSMERKYLTPQIGVSEAMLSITKELGEVAGTVSDAIGDGVLTDRERVACMREIDDVEQSCEALKRSLIDFGDRKIRVAS